MSGRLQFVVAFLAAALVAGLLYVQFFPHLMSAAVEYRMTADARAAGEAATNLWFHSRTLFGPEYRAVVKPNNDTLYSSAFVDVGDGPLLLSLPETGERYYSLQILDRATKVVGLISRRTHGGAGGDYFLAPIGWTGAVPADTSLIEVPEGRLWLIVRFLVEGDDDVPTVHDLQDGLRITPQ